MKKNLFFLTTLMGLSLSTILKAENVLYCESELATGLFKEGNTYRESSFIKERLTIKFNKDYTRLDSNNFGDSIYMNCSLRFKHVRPNTVFCVAPEYVPDIFIYNKITKRFLLTKISSGGYVNNLGDTDIIYAGSCQKF